MKLREVKWIDRNGKNSWGIVLEEHFNTLTVKVYSDRFLNRCLGADFIYKHQVIANFEDLE